MSINTLILFLPELVKYAADHTDFVELLILQNPEVPDELERIIVTALEMGNTEIAQYIFDAFQLNDHVASKDVTKLIERCIFECKNGDEIDTISLFRDTLYASFRDAADPEQERHFKKWDEEIRKYIEKTKKYIEEMTD